MRPYAPLYNSTKGKRAGCIWHLVCDASMGQCACDLRFRTGGVSLRALTAKAGGLPMALMVAAGIPPFTAAVALGVLSNVNGCLT